MRRTQIVSIGLTVFTLVMLSSATAVAEPPAGAKAPETSESVLLWRRGAGAPNKKAEAASKLVALDSLPVTERSVTDVRGKTWQVRGVKLTDLLVAAPFDASSDAVALRFKNGVRVQLNRADVASFDVFLARAWRMSDQGAWSNAFEPVPVGTAQFKVARSLTFSGHRVFAKPDAAPRGAGTFAPWAYVDALINVEILNADAWHKTLDVGASVDEKRGLAVFENRCQSCHGVRGAGASLGWDFVDPLPLASWRDVESLFSHVRAHKLADAEVGLLMPAQPDVTKDEIAALHAWMKVVAQKKSLPPYQP
jgi:mono/diheme cytochrome c family protein